MAYTTINDPSAHFQAKIYTGTGASHNITNDGPSDLQPDWVWVKNRGTTNGAGYQHQTYDSTRGVTKKLLPSGSNAQSTDTNSLTAFNSNGFTSGSNVGINESNVGHVAMQWKANGGTTSSNTSGTEDSVVQVNTDAGFSIVTATAPSSNGHWSFGHGLGVKPDMVITRQRSGGGWWTWHKDLTNQTTYYIGLNTDSAQTNEANMWGGGMTSSVVGVSSPNSTLASEAYVAYCFAEVQGYSKFSSYLGNGSANGPMVYTGFKPAFLIMKETSSAGGNWVMFDNKRDPYNVTKHRMFPNLINGDNTTRDYIDFYSNGFKMKNTDADHNQTKSTMIYMAFAENPFVTSTGIPATAK